MMHLLVGLSTLFIAISFSSPIVERSHPVRQAPPLPTWPAQNFESVRYLPPRLTVNKSNAALGDGLIFFTSAQPSLHNPPVPAEQGPLIMTDSGELVWNGPITSYATNLRAATYQGKPALSYFSGVANNLGTGYGNVTILDDTYTPVATVCPQLNVVTPKGVKFPCYVDLHEALVTERDTMLITVTNTTTADLSPLGGPADGWVLDSMFMEVNISTNEVLFRWSALEAGVPINSSKFLTDGKPFNGTGNSQENPFDWMHLNSVQPLPDGSYLANARHTWATYKVNSKGAVDWTINGDTGGDFTLPKDTHFEWQHDAHILNETGSGALIAWFNNYNHDNFNGTHPTQGLILSLNYATRNATVVKTIEDPNDKLYSVSQGSFQILDNGNILLGYGSNAYIKEYGPEGDVRLTLGFGVGSSVASYRAFRQTWKATPAADPVVVAKDGKAYMSWNGATDVTSWQVYAGDTETTLTPVGTPPKGGFETIFELPPRSKFVQVSAYGGNNALRNSSVVPVDVASE